MTKIRALAGRELSEEDIGASADEAECGYDIDEAIGSYGGMQDMSAILGVAAGHQITQADRHGLKAR
jgi:hypothetical protein